MGGGLAMIRLALALLLLTGCAHKPPAVYGQLNPCMIHDGTIYCAESAEQAERDAWAAYHLEPSRDEAEVAALRLHAWGATADSATTIIGLAVCAGAREANPIVALVPGGWLVIPLSWMSHRYLTRIADRTSRYESAGQGIRSVAYVRSAAAVFNAGTIIRCM